jgi:hypothetical protein
MPGKVLDFVALVERYESLGAADRKAVRRNFSPGELEILKNARAEIKRARRAEQATERQFKGYSPWLVDLIEHALEGDPTQLEVTAECLAAIASVHQTIVDERCDETLASRLGRLLGIPAPRGVAVL